MVGQTQEDLKIVSFFTFFSYYVHVTRERDSLCLWIAICVLNFLCRRIRGIEIEKKQICPNPPPRVDGFGHSWGAFWHNYNQ